MGAYVDDLTIVSSDPEALAWLDTKLAARFPMQATEAKNLDAEKGKDGVGWVLSMEVLYYPRLGICELKQEHTMFCDADYAGSHDSRDQLTGEQTEIIVLSCPARINTTLFVKLVNT